MSRVIARAVQLANRVPGWMEVSELRWLAQQASLRTRIVEFGSFQGRSAKAMASATPGTLWCVDPWEEISCIPPHVPIWDAFQRHHAGEIRSGKVVVLRMSSREAGPVLGGMERRPEMIFIDARHEYEEVSHDIELARSLLGAGGLLCGHDYAPAWPGVVRAVDELVPGFSLPTRGAGSIWAVQL